MGLGLGSCTIIIGVLIRLIFSPLNISNNKMSFKSKILNPDLLELQHSMNQARSKNLPQIAIEEKNKLADFRQKNGIEGGFVKVILNFIQGLSFVCYSSLIQKYIYRLEENPEILTGGFLWFKDLTMPDPFFILPILNFLFICSNFYSLSYNSSSPIMIKMRKYHFFIMLSALPIMTTIPVGIVLYIFATTSSNLLITLLFERYYIRKDNYLDYYIKDSRVYKMVSFLAF